MGMVYRRSVAGTGTKPSGARSPDTAHGKREICPTCGTRFWAVWWVKYYVNGVPLRESTGTEKEAEARKILKRKEGRALSGEPLLPRVDRMRYEEAAADLRTHYRTTGERGEVESETRLAHLDPFFRGQRLSALGGADVSWYIAARQAEGAASGTINRELGVLGRMLPLASENRKLLRLPVIHRLKQAKPREGFFERGQFEAVKGRMRPDLQVAVTIENAFGWRCQNEVLTLQRSQVDLGACTVRLAPGTTKNNEGRPVYLTPELVELFRAQEERVVLLEMELARPVPWLFPHFDKRYRGRRVQDYRIAWRNAYLEATLDLERLEGAARQQRRAELRAALARKEMPGLLRLIRHDFRRTAVRNLVNRGCPSAWR
jgi:hypothetical protein